ncbi:uncharacterized protein [Palaemon carinicauda]|uniref:uncharacterized protein n=1 Tax=Palaemon carinicauda TaxID=392227 RepID=UPI0035B636E7
MPTTTHITTHCLHSNQRSLQPFTDAYWPHRCNSLTNSQHGFVLLDASPAHPSDFALNIRAFTCACAHLLTSYPKVFLENCDKCPRHLNMQTELDHYPLPNITDVTFHLQKTKVFFILNFLKGYYKNGLLFRYDKCNFGINEALFFGNRITPEGVHPLPEKVNALQNFHSPPTIKALKEFLGMIIYYHHFQPAMATTLVLHHASPKCKLKDGKWGPL